MNVNANKCNANDLSCRAEIYNFKTIKKKKNTFVN